MQAQSIHQKFDLLFLEEGEHYVQDFFGKVRYYDFMTHTYRDAEAQLHFCSRSLIVEFPKQPSLPLYKYLIRYMTKQPLIDTVKKSMLISVERVIEVATNSPVPKPYIYYQAKKDLRSRPSSSAVDGDEELSFELAV